MVSMVRDLKVVRDSVITPRVSLSSSSSEPSHPYLQTLIPLTVFDLANYNCPIPILYAFQPPMPDNRTMEDALARTLFYYPHLVGSFVNNDADWPCIVLNDAGVRLVETEVPTTLADNLPFDPTRDLANLVPPFVRAKELFMVQLNRFSCGGLVIATASQHRVADGRAMSAFLVTWASMARGNEVPASLPFHDRDSVSAPRDRPSIDFPHHETEFLVKSSPLFRKPLSGIEVAASLAGMTNVNIHYSKDFISKLKARARDCDISRTCSTFQCILAHVWKKVTAAGGLSPGEYTTIRTAVDGRMRMMNPPVPQTYFGNLILWAFPSLKAGELLSMSYAEVASVIRRAVSKVDEAYFRSCIDFAELKLKRSNTQDVKYVSTLPAAGHMLTPNIEFNSWLGLQFNDVDFGGGPPCYFCPPMLPIEGLAILIPSIEDRGGVNLFIAMNKEAASHFHEIAYSLDLETYLKNPSKVLPIIYNRKVQLNLALKISTEVHIL